MEYVNHVKRYTDALRLWRASGMPDRELPVLDNLWDRLTQAEKTMAAKLIACEITNERVNDKD
jgi:hypothetical protein